MRKSRLAMMVGIAAALGDMGTIPTRRRILTGERAKPETFDELIARHTPLHVKQPDTSGYGYAKKQRAASRRRKS